MEASTLVGAILLVIFGNPAPVGEESKLLQVPFDSMEACMSYGMPAIYETEPFDIRSAGYDPSTISFALCVVETEDFNLHFPPQ